MALRPLVFSEYFGHNYDEYITLKKYISAMKTGKSAKKSSTVARKIVLRLITNQSACAIILRKVMLDHEKSTFPAIIKAFNKFEKLTGYKWRNDWEVLKGAKNPQIRNNKTGQIMRFVSFDKPESLAGLELEDDRIQYLELWFEEPMQIVDKNSGSKDSTVKQQQEKQNFDIIISSGFRGQLINPNEHREITFTFNDWSDGDYWILAKFIKPFINENQDILEYFGLQSCYDPSFEDGKGIYVMVGTGGLNEYNDQDYLSFIKDIKKNDPEFYKAIWLGTVAQIFGNAYSPANIKKIKVGGINLEKIEEWLVGIDYSATKDKTIQLLIGYNDQDKTIQVVDGWQYHRGKAASQHKKNPLMPPEMSEPDMIRYMYDLLDKWRIKYKFSKYENKAEVHVDPRDATVKSYLQEYYDDGSTSMRTDYMRPVGASKFKSSSSFVRILATRYFMGAGKITIAPHLTWLMDEWKIRTIKRDGSIQDGNDDAAQAFEYAWSHMIDKMMPEEAYEAILYAAGEMQWHKNNNLDIQN